MTHRGHDEGHGVVRDKLLSWLPLVDEEGGRTRVVAVSAPPPATYTYTNQLIGSVQPKYDPII